MSPARKCTGYDPVGDLVEVHYDGQVEKELFLKVQNRMLWFHQYLTEHKASGVIDDSNVTYLPDAKLLLVKATVTINGKTVGKACAGEFYDTAIGAQDPTICQTVLLRPRAGPWQMPALARQIAWNIAKPVSRPARARRVMYVSADTIRVLT